MYSVAFSPDGKTIVSGSYDQTIKVWDAGEPFQLLPISLSRPHHTLLSTDSLTLIKEKQNAHYAKYGHASIKDVKFAPDGTKIVSCGGDQMIKVWDAGDRFFAFERPLGAPLTPSLRCWQPLLCSRRAKRTPTAIV